MHNVATNDCATNYSMNGENRVLKRERERERVTNGSEPVEYVMCNPLIFEASGDLSFILEDSREYTTN